MRKTQNKSNVLNDMEARLTSLTNDSANAVSLITNTITRLEVVNSRIADTRQEIEDYREELSRIEGSMDEQYDRNAKMIGKFKSFFED